MNQQHYLIKGTLLLTAAGMITRTAGFFYKIFLSRSIGANEIGLFQLVLPVLSLCMAAANGGMQTAISRFTAKYEAQKEHAASRRLLFSALLFSAILSILCSLLLIFFADWIALHYLLEPSCQDLLRIAACSLPLAAIHSCVCGYCIGIKNVSLPAFSQLIEQLSRILTVVLFFCLIRCAGHTPDARIMALGQIAGELAAVLSCICFLLFSDGKQLSNPSLSSAPVPAYLDCIKLLLTIALPLALNRILTCILQSIEAALLPQKLQEFGLSSHDALSSYGILTGMALPLLLFPTAVTNAAATLLLPIISEAQTLRQTQKIRTTVRTCILCTISLGSFFLLLLFFGGSWIGKILFDSTEAGTYIRLLAFSCPFLYLNTTLLSVLHGIGKTSHIFIWNLICFVLRLLSVIVLVPTAGVTGYIIGTIGSQIFLSCCICFSLHSLVK